MHMYFSGNFQEIMLVPWNIMKCIGLGWCLIIVTHLRRGKLQNRNSLRMETEHDRNDGKSYCQLHRWVYCCIFVQNCRCVIFAGSCVTSKKMRIVQFGESISFTQICAWLCTFLKIQRE